MREARGEGGDHAVDIEGDAAEDDDQSMFDAEIRRIMERGGAGEESPP